MMHPELKVYENSNDLSQAAARIFAVVAAESVARRGRFVVALSGGGTPKGLYRLLSGPPYRTSIPWRHTHIFWGDERLVPPDDPGSNYGQVAGILLDRISIPATNAHRLKGESNPDEAVSCYKEELRLVASGDRAWPRFDLALMGLGGDGHTASLFPGPVSAVEQTEPVVAVTADYNGRPANRISLTPLVFNDARQVLFLVAGASKAEVLAAVVNGPYRPELWPAQRIQPHTGKVTWLIDEAAARKLPAT
jgi:6-phosphogluconolactonase